MRETSRIAKRPLYSPKDQPRTPWVPGVASARIPIFASDAERGGRCGNLEKLTTPHWHRTSASACTFAKTCMGNTKNGDAMSSSVAARAEARPLSWVCWGSGARRNRQKVGSHTMSWRVSKMVQCTPSLYVAMGHGHDGRTRRVRAVLTMPQLEQLADPMQPPRPRVRRRTRRPEKLRNRRCTMSINGAPNYEGARAPP